MDKKTPEQMFEELKELDQEQRDKYIDKEMSIIDIVRVCRLLDIQNAQDREAKI